MSRPKRTPASIAAGRLGKSRTKPMRDVISEQHARVEALTERIGRLMSQRVDEEEILAAMYKQLSSSDRAELGLPAREGT